MQKEQLLNTTGHFLWSFGVDFFIETELGNFIWSCPDYEGGNNTVRAFSGNFHDWLKLINLDFARSKGLHQIHAYIGENFILEN